MADFGEGNGSPLQYSCLENSVDKGAWWAAVHGVAKSWTQLKRLSMHACIGEGNGNPLQYSCLENPRDRGTWWAAIYRVTQSQTPLKRLSSSSSLADLQCCISFRLQQSDSVLHIHLKFFFKFFFQLGYCRVLSRIPCAT
ncbi:unnamed protein product [Rangifer tarandus platyrhynchus]|uniref:Fucolectin tachylectin-4 pentraxin-1 domain-containing protein n=2 Tax=Rangifer tarandus platyrhynchus TaxID=3082113 RepID=A0ABN8YL93_RANTA|nr:unnamed protein product [Rangifer tarandus platyrhynchus]